MCSLKWTICQLMKRFENLCWTHTIYDNLTNTWTLWNGFCSGIYANFSYKQCLFSKNALMMILSFTYWERERDVKNWKQSIVKQLRTGIEVHKLYLISIIIFLDEMKMLIKTVRRSQIHWIVKNRRKLWTDLKLVTQTMQVRRIVLALIKKNNKIK